MTYSDYVEWMEYLDMDIEMFHREDAYLAQIAAEIRRGNVKHPKQVKLEDFLRPVRLKTPAQTSTRTPQQRLSASKQAWLGALGLKSDGTPIHGATVKKRKPKPKRKGRRKSDGV